MNWLSYSDSMESSSNIHDPIVGCPTLMCTPGYIH